MARQECVRLFCCTRGKPVRGFAAGALALVLAIFALLMQYCVSSAPGPSPVPQVIGVTPSAAAAGAADTPQPATFTPTSGQSPTSTALPQASRTPLPSLTATRTATLQPPSTPIRTALPTPVPQSPSPTPSSTASYVEPMLIEPKEGSSHTGSVTFRWQSAGALGPGDVYDVRAWRGETELGVGRTSATELTVSEPPVTRGTGNYRWRVVVIHVRGEDAPDEWAIVGPMPEPRSFYWGQAPKPTPSPTPGGG